MKAILVIDTPKNCAECKLMFLQGIGESICNAVDWSRRPSWCPLKDLPSNKEMKGDWENVVDVWVDGANYGYNKCLNDISGETE